MDKIKERENELQKEYKYKTHILENDIGNLIWAFINRKRFKYSVSQILLYVLTCVCIRCKHNNRRNPNLKPHFMFSKAEDKFMNELDAIRIVRTLRKFKMLA